MTGKQKNTDASAATLHRAMLLMGVITETVVCSCFALLSTSKH